MKNIYILALVFYLLTNPGSVNSACPVPANISVSGITSTSAIISWDSMEASGFQVRYKISGTSTFTIVNTSSNILTLTGLEIGTSYVLYIRSLCGDTYSYSSSVKSFRTLGYGCSFPEEFAISNVTDTSVQISWNEVEGAEGYQFKVGPVDNELMTYNTSENYIVIGSLLPGINYVFKIRTKCGPGQWSQFSKSLFFKTSGNAICLPNSTNTANITHNSAKLIWNEIPESDFYIFRYRKNGGSFITDTVEDKNQIEIFGLLSNAKYQWQVKTNCGGGVFTPLEYFTTLPQPAAKIGDFEEENADVNFKLFPNPSNGIISIEIDDMLSYSTLQICNTEGACVYKSDISSGAQKVDLSVLNKGVYFVIISGEKNKQVQKLVLF